MTTSQPIDPTDDQPDPTPKRRWAGRLKSPKLWLAAGLALAVLVGAGVGSFYLFSPKRSTASRTRTVEVSQGDQTSTVSLDGTLSPRTQANLNFAVSGEVTKVYVSAGQKVTKGQKLARVDDSSLQDAVDIAEANLTSAQANYSDVASSGSSAAITAASAQVDSAVASLSSAKTAVKNATLRATMSGTIASVDVSVGDQVTGSGSTASSGQAAAGGGSTSSSTTSTSTAQVVLISTSTWKLEGSVGATDLASLKAGQAATVTADGTDYPATLASVGIVATSTSDGSATFPVVVNLTGTQSGLYSGTTASAVITTGTYKNVLTVATAAISSDNGTTVVTKVNADGTTTLTTVEVGRVFGDATEITSGLSAGDSVQISLRPSSSSTSGSSSDSGGLLGGGGMGGGMGGGLDSGGPPAGGAPAGGPGR